MSDKINLSFKDTEEERKLLKWIEENAKILGKSNFIKQVLYERMLKDEVK